MTDKTLKTVPKQTVDADHARTEQERGLLRNFRLLSVETRWFLSKYAAALVADQKPALRLVAGGAR